MDLSVIIVSYNVKYFLEQCLHAVINSSKQLDNEIFVIDNNSADGSVQMVAEKFPSVKLISNGTNTGFARANNQAIQQASGRYVLLLNPDTLVQEDTFHKCMAYMDEHPDAGSLGVKMIDGKGSFLPESKRALPTPAVAFFKIFGFTALFPRSRTFGRYHLGYLDKDTIHDVDVISGAYMFLRKSVLDKTGWLDEDFFMYGEDIDLSYRIKMAGFRNVYFPHTTIIHYKGESTKKGSINYVIMFYNAMIIFSRKHFSKSTARYYALFIHLAIYVKAGVSILQRFVRGIINPLLDALFIYAGYHFFLPVWEKHIFGAPEVYPDSYLHAVIPAYIAVWLLSAYLATGYEKMVKLADLVRGIAIGSLFILLTYALLPESYRFSRALILLGSGWALIVSVSSRLLLSLINRNQFRFEAFKRKKRIVIIGEEEESRRVFTLINQTNILPELIGYVFPVRERVPAGFIGHLGQIEEIVKINRADELIFCSGNMTSESIIKTMLLFPDTDIDFKIAPPESLSVIGSNSNVTSGELYVLHFNTLSRLLSRRKKRLFDIALSLVLIVISPLLLILVHNPGGLIRNLFNVVIGKGSWVGYFKSTGGNHPGLPRIRTGILTPADGLPGVNATHDVIEKLNLNYAKDYRIINDLYLIVRGFRNLGRKPEKDDLNKSTNSY